MTRLELLRRQAQNLLARRRDAQVLEVLRDPSGAAEYRERLLDGLGGTAQAYLRPGDRLWIRADIAWGWRTGAAWVPVVVECLGRFRRPYFRYRDRGLVSPRADGPLHRTFIQFSNQDHHAEAHPGPDDAVPRRVPRLTVGQFLTLLLDDNIREGKVAAGAAVG